MTTLTVAGVLALVVGLLPGLPGDWVYRLVAGSRWREKDLQYVLRLLGFSVLGLAIYSIIAARYGLPRADYVDPATFRQPDWTRTLPQLSAAFLGHSIGSGVGGAVAALAVALLRKLPHISSPLDAWDEFVREDVPDRWVVVSLDDGDAYAGMLSRADISTSPENRDLVLLEPAKYDPEAGHYEASSSQYLFLPGSRVVSILAVVKEGDERLVAIGRHLFQPQGGGPADAITREGYAPDQEDSEGELETEETAGPT